MWSTLKKVMSLMTTYQKRQIYFAIALSLSLATIELIGIGSAVLVLSGIFAELNGTSQNQNFTKLMGFFALENATFKSQVTIISGVTLGLLITKSLVGLKLNEKYFQMLSSQSAHLSKTYATKLFSLKYSVINSFKGMKLLQGVTNGVEKIYLGFIGGIITIVVELIFLIFITLGVALYDPLIPITLFCLFIPFLIVLNLSLGAHYRRAGKDILKSSINLSQFMYDGINIFKELFVRNKTSFYSRYVIGEINKQVPIKAKLYSLNNVTKYYLEIALLIVMAAFVLQKVSKSGLEVTLQGVVVFVLIASRISPSLLKIHSTILAMKQTMGDSDTTVELLKIFENAQNFQLQEEQIGDQVSKTEFSPSASLKNIVFQYEDIEQKSNQFKLIIRELQISPGDFIGVVGSSGSGKTSLCEVILGIRQPQIGSASISGLPAEVAVRRWSDKISYVPQSSYLLDSSIAVNVSLDEQPNLELVESALRKVGMRDFFKNFELESRPGNGDWWSKVSGGEKQRLVIARGIYSNPSLLVLDEATSSLDVNTEKKVLTNIVRENPQQTTVMITHRINSALICDKIILMEKGRISDYGTVNHLKKKSAKFRELLKDSGI